VEGVDVYYGLVQTNLAPVSKLTPLYTKVPNTLRQYRTRKPPPVRFSWNFV